MGVDLSILISFGSLCVAAFFGYHIFIRNNGSDTADRASLDARILTKLDNISDDLKDIQRDNRDMRKEINHINERVLILEQKVKDKAKKSAEE